MTVARWTDAIAEWRTVVGDDGVDTSPDRLARTLANGGG